MGYNEKNKNINLNIKNEKENKNLINKDKIEQLLLKKEKIMKSKKN